jgi:DinB superfamily
VPFRLDRALEVLERTPRAIEAVLGGLSPEWLTVNEGPETFSPVDVLGHLIHGEETDWIPRARIILEHGEARAFEPFDRFAFRRTLAGVPLPTLLATFARLRASSLSTLRALDLQPAQLALRGTHPSLGPVTLEQLLATWVVHDLGHLGQITRVMAKHYREDVGPWREYLPVLDRR